MTAGCEGIICKLNSLNRIIGAIIDKLCVRKRILNLVGMDVSVYL